MKKVLCALCAAALLLTACGGGESQEESPQAQMLQNRQKQVIMYITQTNYDENGEVSGWFRTEHRYDTKGNLLGMDNYDGYGSWWENTYNADGVLVSCSYYNTTYHICNIHKYLGSFSCLDILISNTSIRFI